MSDNTEHTGRPTPPPDPDAWSTACEEDLTAERARRSERYGAPPGDAAAELRALADAVTEKIGRLGAALGPGIGMAAGPLAAQARSALDPVIERNADTFQHLANAGQELLAAYRAAVLGHERRWSRPASDEPPGANRDDGGEPGDTPGSERVDLD
ncbi:DUF5304 domain-containing protein [Streptomyces sp. NBC_01803]|uniref:DUF5304 domain-containing protein n=1 Tax=Streptomyces sp. NBC_01803 TaxID=2975946 RepID=UPI002DDA23AC|nr:DUF5304 domain-containing protein [Streptomyces sp. NBC_01803]WSA46619.1 DUF5304 domain-containing protein [Streptomyces sp. NBC_01803]